MKSITPFLWFDNQAEEAARFYIATLKHGKITNASNMVVSFEILGQEFLALNGGKQDFHFNESVSFVVTCENQGEVDYLWDALSAGGEKGRCGWLTDKYGLSWQVVPEGLSDVLSGDDEAGSERAFAAMMKMDKLVLAELQEAYAGL